MPNRSNKKSKDFQGIPFEQNDECWCIIIILIFLVIETYGLVLIPIIIYYVIKNKKKKG